jgi:hypothetical protein
MKPGKEVRFLKRRWKMMKWAFVFIAALLISFSNREASKDPAAPCFYYNLVCALGELNDPDGSAANLEKAPRYRPNSVPEQGWPDPTKDGSFARFSTIKN